LWDTDPDEPVVGTDESTVEIDIRKQFWQDYIEAMEKRTGVKVVAPDEQEMAQEL
jgi:hypothetical protein